MKWINYINLNKNYFRKFNKLKIKFLIISKNDIYYFIKINILNYIK